MRPIEIYILLDAANERFLCKQFKRFMKGRTREEVEDHVYQIYQATAEEIKNTINEVYEDRREKKAQKLRIDRGESLKKTLRKKNNPES